MRLSMDLLYWGPVQDDDFFDGKSLDKLNHETPVRNTLYGCTKGEGLIFTLITESVIVSVFANVIGRKVNQQANYTKEDLIDHVKSYLASEEIAGPNVDQIQKMLLDYYAGGGDSPTLAPKFWYTRFTDAQTDGQFSGGQIHEIIEKFGLNWKQHIYLFDYIHPSHRPLVGIDSTYTPHAYEYQYLMDGQPYFPFQKNETNKEELNFTEKIVDAFANFVKTGEPSTKEVPWPAVTNAENIPYLLVGEKVVAESTHFTPIAKLWQQVYSLGYAKTIFHNE